MENKKKMIEFGFGVSIETIDSDTAKIHNLKSNQESVCNLGVRVY